VHEFAYGSWRSREPHLKGEQSHFEYKNNKYCHLDVETQVKLW